MEKNHVGWVTHELESASTDLYKIFNDRKLGRLDKVLKGTIALSYLCQRCVDKLTTKPAVNIHKDGISLVMSMVTEYTVCNTFCR